MINDDIDDAELATLLPRYQDATGDDRQAIGNLILTKIRKHFNECLRPGLGRQFARSAQDTSIRYTAMVNKFFVEVLQKQPNQFWRAKSLRALRNFASTVIANDIRDVLRRQKLRGALGDDDLDDLAFARAEHFRGRHKLDLEVVLSRLEIWKERNEPWPQRERVLRHRYIDGLTYEEIAQQEQCPIERVYRLKEDAIEAMRREIAQHQQSED